MKKFAFLSLLFFGILLHAQCTISGKSTMNLNTEEIYSVPNETAQCKDCHLWVGVGNSASISGDNRQSSVKIKANATGRQVLSVAILTQQGLMQCSKNIDIIDSKLNTIGTNNSNNGVTTTLEPVQKPDCNIKINDFKEVKYAENIVSFFPIGDDNQYRYIWTAIYMDGREITSKEKVPQFPYTKTDGIKTVKLQMISDKCLRSLSKTYDNNYWEFF